jgi:acyl-coenzyme A thioesterase PaaI-like protein
MSLFLKSLKELPPFGQALGMVLEEADTGPGVAVLLPGAEHLSGDAEDAVFHTSVILATIDNTAGWCIRDHPDYAEGTSMATLDLRVDFVTPARLSETLRVRAVCEGFDGDIAFVRATAQTLKTKVLIATGQATFMLGTPDMPNLATPANALGGPVD